MANKPLDILGREIRIGDIIAYAIRKYDHSMLGIYYVFCIDPETTRYGLEYKITCLGYSPGYPGMDFGTKATILEKPSRAVVLNPASYDNNIRKLIKEAQDNYNEQGKKIKAGK